MIPSLESFLFPVLLEVANSKGGIKRKEICERVAEKFNLTEEDKEQRTSSGAHLYLVRPNWCISYLSQASYIRAISRGIYAITDEGKEIVTNSNSLSLDDLWKSPSYAEWGKRTEEAAKLRRLSNKEPIGGVQSDKSDELRDLNVLSLKAPEEILQDVLETIETKLKKEIADNLERLSPYAFETLCVQLIKAIYKDSTGFTTKKSRDGGIDGIINKDPLGLDKVYIQAKKHNRDSKITPSLVQSFKGALDDHRASAGVIITTASFSEEAVKSASSSSVSLSLIDGDRLAELMITYNVGCSTRNVFKLKGIDTDFFDELEQ